MEKKVSNSFGVGPWMMKKIAMTNFREVTEQNRKNATVYGRIMYVISMIGSNYQYRGSFCIEPRYTKGAWRIPFKPWMNGFPGHFNTTFPEDTDYTEWAASNKAMIDKFIEEKTLYIRPTDEILTFIKDN